MIIRCEKCGTKFQLDDDAVKPAGTKVRCSVCKHIFTVYPPGVAGAPVPRERAGDRISQVGDKKKIAAPVRRLPGGVDDFEDFLSEMDDDFLDEDLTASRRRKRDEKAEGNAPDGFTVSKQEKKRPSVFWRICRFFLLLILVLILIVAALYYWKPGLVREYGKFIEKYIPVTFFKTAGETPDAGASRLVLSGVSGDFIGSGMSGDLFVIRGTVKNEFPGGRSFIQLRGNILDKKGTVVSNRTVYAGNPIADEKLNVMSTEEISAAMNNRGGMDGMNVNVPSGSSIPFAIVFEELPENVVEFTVEPVSSTPATP
jgi:predicted Zn finger-like uncharacterized protein